MNAKFILATLISLSGIKAFAQEKLSKITAPTSPASYLLGIQPSAVLAPKSYQALETALYSNFVNSDGKTILPNDFALEFTPYWATNHGLPLKSYLTDKRLADQVWRNLSFSVASSQNIIMEDKSASNGLSLGIRTTVFEGNKLDKSEVDKYLSLIRDDAALTSLIGSQLAPIYSDGTVNSAGQFLPKAIPIIVSQIEAKFGILTKAETTALKEGLEKGVLQFSSEYITDKSVFKGKFIDLLFDAMSAVKKFHAHQSSKLLDEFEEYLKKRNGFSLDLAWGSFLNFPTNRFEYSFVPKQAFWITPAYNFSNRADFLKITGVIRYEWYAPGYYQKYFPSSKTFENNIDYGISVAAELENCTFQIEGVGRSRKTEVFAGNDNTGNKLYRKEKDKDFQCIGSFSYRLTDQIALSYSLGNRFATIIDQNKSLVSLLSLNFGLGGPTDKDIDYTK